MVRVVSLLIAAVLAVPRGLDLYMPVPPGSPLTRDSVALGRSLFFDRRLSVDGSVSCASCHRPERSFADDRRIAVGVFSRLGRRHVPTIVNRGYGRLFAWDGRNASLEFQVIAAIADPSEMGLSPATAANRVALSPEQLTHALASYVRSILAGAHTVRPPCGWRHDGAIVRGAAGPLVVPRQGQLHCLPHGPEFHGRKPA